MILLWGVVLGLIAGLTRAWRRQRVYELPPVNGWGTVMAAFLLQLPVFFLPQSRERIPDGVASGALILSMGLLLVVVVRNRQQLAFQLMGAGLLMNLVVILANGGFMPVSPATIATFAPDLSPDKWSVGERFGPTKDIVLEPENTRLIWLSDRFAVPDWYPQRVVFSLGDVILAAGAFMLMWQGGAGRQKDE